MNADENLLIIMISQSFSFSVDLSLKPSEFLNLNFIFKEYGWNLEVFDYEKEIGYAIDCVELCENIVDIVLNLCCIVENMVVRITRLTFICENFEKSTFWHFLTFKCIFKPTFFKF